MEIKTRVMKGTKQTPKHMFERMVQHEVEEQTGTQVYASGLEYSDMSDMWYFRCEAIKRDETSPLGVRYLTYDGYIGCLGRVVITKTNGKKEVA